MRARGLKRSPWRGHFTFAAKACSIDQEIDGASFPGKQMHSAANFDCVFTLCSNRSIRVATVRVGKVFSSRPCDSCQQWSVIRLTTSCHSIRTMSRRPSESLFDCIVNAGGGVVGKVTNWLFSKAPDGVHQPDVAFLNQVQHGNARGGEMFLGNAHDLGKVTFN